MISSLNSVVNSQDTVEFKLMLLKVVLWDQTFKDLI